MPVIEVSGLVKHYDAVRADDGVDLQVEAGEFFGVLGPNGAGKTTLLELVEGLRRPDAGTVQVCGLSLGRATRRCCLAWGCNCKPRPSSRCSPCASN